MREIKVEEFFVSRSGFDEYLLLFFYGCIQIRKVLIGGVWLKLCTIFASFISGSKL